MGRPRKEGMDYFPHDTDAVSDEKVEALRLLFGNDGYAFYFILLERIYRTPNAELDVSAPETLQILARKVGVTDHQFEKMLAFSLSQYMFDNKSYSVRKKLTSKGIKRRSNVVVQKRIEAREKYAESKIEKADNDEGTVSGEFLTQKPDRNATKGSKGKERIENNDKGKGLAADAAASKEVAPVEDDATLFPPPAKEAPKETEVQRVIRECWEMLDLGDMPNGEGQLKGYSGLTQLFVADGWEVIERQVKQCFATKPQPTGNANPWAFFCKQFRLAVNQPWDFGVQKAGSRSGGHPSGKGVADVGNHESGEVVWDNEGNPIGRRPA